MSHVITIYGFGPSTWTRTARIACAEKGVEHRLEPVDYGSDAHAALHPFRRIPVARIDGQELYETVAIVSYLDAVVAGPALLPADALERARVLGWFTAGVHYLYPDLVRALLGDDLPEGAHEAIATHLATLEAQLGDRGFLVGGGVTAADLVVAPMLDFARSLLDLSAPLAAAPRVSAWLEELTARPSFTATAAAIPA